MDKENKYQYFHKIYCQCSGGHTFILGTNKPYCTDIRCQSCPNDDERRKIKACKCSGGHNYLDWDQDICEPGQ